jgi:hypothetical protein
MGASEFVLTDPPYNVAFESASGLNQERQMKTEQSQLPIIIVPKLAETWKWRIGILIPCDTEVKLSAEHFGRRLPLVGNVHLGQGQLCNGALPYLWQHEPIPYGWLKTGRTNGTTGEASHHLELCQNRSAMPTSTRSPRSARIPIQNSSQPNGIVLDTFVVLAVP